ncbi:MFS transporter [Jatrophihabitans sp. DSM 45814]
MAEMYPVADSTGLLSYPTSKLYETPPEQGDEPGLPSRTSNIVGIEKGVLMRKWWPLVAVSLGTFMLLVDITIVNVALPAMAADLKTSYTSLQWVVDIYALALAALLLAAGTVADRVGHRRVYLIGLGLFALASLASGLSPNSGFLIAARGLQGIGGAAMFATTFALLNSSYQGRDRGTAYGIWGAVGGASAAIGPIVGGLLTEWLSWRWIFFVNLPVSVITVALVLTVLQADRPEGKRTNLDLPGLLTFGLSTGGLTYGLIVAGEDGWGSAAAVTWFAIAVISAVVFVVVERRVAAPMLDLRLLGNASFSGSLIAGFFLSGAAFAGLVYSSIWLQSVLGMSPIQAGLAGGLPLSAAAFVVSAAAGQLLHDRNPGLVIGVGLLFIGAGGVVEAIQLHGDADWTALLIGLILVGIGVGAAIPVLSSTAMSAVPLQRGGMAAGAVNTARQLGLAVGIAVLGSVFASRIGASFADSGLPSAEKLGHAVAGGQGPIVLNSLPPAQRPAFDQALHTASLSGLSWVMGIAGAAGLVAGIIVLLMIRPTRSASAVAGPTEHGHSARTELVES